MELAPHVPIERCRLAKYDIRDEVMNQSFDLDEVSILLLYYFIIKFSLGI